MRIYNKDIEESEIDPLIYFVKFRHIFVDINNTKTAAKSYTTAVCVNKAIKRNSSFYSAVEWAFPGELKYKIPDASSDQAIEIVKQKVCDKYAKF